jgi:predicted phosphodiesterase
MSNRNKDHQMKTRNYINTVLLCSLCVFVTIQLYGRQKFSVQARGYEKRIRHNDKELLLEFTKQLDKDSLEGNIQLRDSAGSLEGNYTVEMYQGDNTGKTVWIKFNDGFSLKESSKYYVDITRGLRYVRYVGGKGKKLYSKIGKTKTFYFVTTSECPFSADANTDSAERTKLIIISDIHIGGPRATAGKYNWFKDNVSEFYLFLDDVLNSKQIKELIIAGDLFDEWIMPMNVKPFVGDVTTSAEFFKSVAEATTMKDIIAKLNEIADSGDIKLIYIPGNHDMLMTEDAMKAIFSNAIWKGTKNSDNNDSGTGYYSPEDGISIEHGHLYDFFNAPDPLTQSGSLLPPGYFVSRMFATKHQDQGQPNKTFWGNAFFYGAWEVVLWKIFGTVEPNVPDIITGIDGYTKSYTYNQARDIYYDADIAGNWKDRQVMDGVYSPESEVSALLAGSGVFIWGDLEYAAWKQYFVPERAKIVIFGHTHMGMLKGYNNANKAIVSDPESSPKKDQLGPTRKIYANSGTWVNKKLVSHGYSTRTYVVVNTTTTDSALTTVSLYQYNPDMDNEIEDVSTLLDEKNIHLETDTKEKSLPLIR